MTVQEFLETVRQGLKQDNIQQADAVVRIVAGALKAGLPEEAESALGRLLPEDMSSAWRDIQPIAPDDFIERENIYMEEGPPEVDPQACPQLSESEKAGRK